MDWLFGQKHIRVGLDIGTDGFKWAAVDRRKGRCHIWHAPIHPKRSSQKDQLGDHDLATRLGELTTACKGGVGVWHKAVTCAAYGNGVLYGYLELEQRSPADLKFGVTSALLKDLPYALEEFELLCVGVPPLSGANKSGAFYTVLPREVLTRIAGYAKACHLKLDGVDAVPLALAREFGHNRQDDESFWAIVHSGYEWTQVVVVQKTCPYYVREIPVAGGHFTYAFQMGKQIGWDAAEQDKRNYNVMETREHYIEPFITRWLGEVKKSIDHFQSKHKRTVEKVALSGGTACWKGLAERLEEHLKLPVKLDGWSQIRPEQPRTEDDALQHKVSIGLALG